MMKNGCIIVSTPFQVLSSFAITEQFRETTFDLYVIGNFAGYEELSEKIRNTSIFRSIVTYELSSIRKYYNDGSRFKSNFGLIDKYLFFEKNVGKLQISTPDYDVVFFAAAYSAIDLIFYFQKKCKPQFYLFDDGVMTYRDINHVLANNGKAKIPRKIVELFIGKIRPTLLIYSPKLFKTINNEKYEIVKLHSLTKEKYGLVKELYSTTESDVFSEKAIVIECKVDDYLSPSENEKLEAIYKVMSEKLTDKIIFKRHPRDSRPFFPGRRYLESSVPFEVLNYVQDMSEKILIAWDSTSVITPKLFSNQEPQVILLYKLVHGKLKNAEETDLFYRAFRECYRDKNRFFIPENMDELIKFISKIDEQ